MGLKAIKIVALLPATLLAIPFAPLFFVMNVYDIFFIPNFLGSPSTTIQTIGVLLLAPCVSVGLAATWIMVFHATSSNRLRSPQKTLLRTCLFLGIIGEFATLVWLSVTYASLEKWRGTAAELEVIISWLLVIMPPIIIAGHYLGISWTGWKTHNQNV